MALRTCLRWRGVIGVGHLTGARVPVSSRAVRGIAVAVALVLVSAAPIALAQDGDRSPEVEDDLPPVASRPTSGEASLLSGRTLGVGETMVAGAAGWPGIWALVEHALTSSFNLGIRAGVTYGSPVMGLDPGVGGELAIPMRIHLLGEGSVDFAVYLEPAFTGAEGASVGKAGTGFSGDFGWSSRLELGGLLGFHVAERLTLLVGLGGYIGFTHVPSAGGPSVVGGALAQLGVEGLISRDTMLFAVLGGGVGFADDPGPGDPVFDPGLTSPILRISFGLAYLL